MPRDGYTAVTIRDELREALELIVEADESYSTVPELIEDMVGEYCEKKADEELDAKVLGVLGYERNDG